MAVEGLDYAYGAHPSPAAMVAAGKAFVCRYGGPGSSDKHLSAAELAGLLAAGIKICANAEGAAGGLKGGYDVGRSWAADADRFFRALGMPADRPIYLSADWDVLDSELAAVDAAMDGAASVIGRDRVGVYGGYRVIAHLAANGKARWFWATYAWSSGRWHPASHVQQYRNGVTFDGADCDLNRAMVPDYGQWPMEDDMPFFDDPNARVLAFRAAALIDMADNSVGANLKPEPNKLAAALKQIAADLAELKARPPADPVAFAAALAGSPAALEVLAAAITAKTDPLGAKAGAKALRAAADVIDPVS